MVNKAFTLLLGLHVALCLQAQPVLRLIDPAGQTVLDIREGQRILFRYQLPNQPERLTGGRLITITDSTIVYRIRYAKARQVIPLSAIHTINRIRFGRGLLSGFVAGALAGSLDVLVNRRNSPIVSTFFLSGALLGAFYYIDAAERRRLARNRVGKGVYILVIPSQ